MTRPRMMNYEIKADSEVLRDRILKWTETNISVPWTVSIQTWDPADDVDGKWGLFIDGGAVSTKRKLLAAFKSDPFSIHKSGTSTL